MSPLSLCISLSVCSLGQQAPYGPTRVAVVDVPAVSERYHGTKDLEAQFEQHRVKFNEQRGALQMKIEQARRSLTEELKPGTQVFAERRKQLVMLEAELQWFVDAQGQQIEFGLAQSLRRIYADIREAVTELAEERGIDVVLAADRLPPEAPPTTQQARQQIVLQKVVFWSPRVDLTEEVITRLNAAYQARQLSPPGGGAALPPVPEETPDGNRP